MHRSGQKIVVIGAGAAGLSVAVGLAERGHDVTVVERRSAQRDWHAARASQTRLFESPGGFPQRREAAANSLVEAEAFRRRLPRTVKELPAWYFVPSDRRYAMGPASRQSAGDRCPLSRSLREANELSAYKLIDRVIDPPRLIAELENQLRLVGGRAIYRAETIGCRRMDNQIATVFVRTPHALQKLASDVLVNAAGVRLQQAFERLGGRASLGEFVRLGASLELQCPWPFSCEPAILQFSGSPESPILGNLRVTPVESTRIASITSDSWLPVNDPDSVEHDVRAEQQGLLRLMAEAFDLLDLPEPHAVAWRLKALESAPAFCERRMPPSPILCGRAIGQSENEILCAPVKLRSVLTLRDAACSAIQEYFESQRMPLAA